MYDLPVYLLDLCIFSYQLHSQTMIWPMDPYYEQLANGKGRRRSTMTDVHTGSWLPPAHQQGPAAYHGPSSCMNWLNTDNRRLDPIVSRYDRLYPWRPGFTRPTREKEEWLIYNTPVEITDRINQVYMVRYGTGGAAPWPYQKSNQPQPPIVVDPIHAGRPSLTTSRPTTYQAPPATDLLYCFEGGTGGSESKPPLWSMMGYVLARVEMINNLPVYDVFIVFRGSRSGRLRPRQSNNKEGNPDWATDLGISEKVQQDPVISSTGSVVKGFRSSLKTILPTLMDALAKIHVARNNASPRYIHVTGHSLGGALAGQFASSMLLGTEYGPNGAGLAMPQTLRAWPWSTMRLVTFSSPAIGGDQFHDRLNQTLPSLRIWLEGDPITQERYHYVVGVPYKIPDIKRVGSFNSHEPYKVRERLVADRSAKGFPITMVPAHAANDQDEPWVFRTTFTDFLNYFAQPGNRKNVAPLSQCLGMGELSSFATEFIVFLKMLDPQDTWTVPLVTWIKNVKPSSVTGWGVSPSIPAFPLAGQQPVNLPAELADLKTYLAVCLVLCALSKGRSLTDMQKMFSAQELAEIENFK